MRIVRSIQEMQDTMLDLRIRQQCRLGLVPTMGCLHEGHLSLVREVRSRGCLPVASVFVNPIQFGPREDFARYPRPFGEDCRLFEQEGVEYLFAPSPEEMYPPGFSVYVEETSLSSGLCGASRPGHFRGVATVVTKLFQIVQPHVAAFGRKDAQQARIIAHLAACLNMPVEISICPIVRESDGLAMSSRNRYLSAAERVQAVGLVEALRAAAALYRNGETRVPALIRVMEQALRRHPLAIPEYVSVVDYASLQPVETAGPLTLFALAVKLGATRLIDNLLISVDGEPVL